MVKRPLLLAGPSDEVIDLLDDANIPFELALTPVEALDTLYRLHDHEPVLAYGERLFGRATTGQAAKLAYDGPRIVLVDTTDARKGRLATALVWQAASALDVHAVVDLSEQRAVIALRAATVHGRTVSGITQQRGVPA